MSGTWNVPNKALALLRDREHAGTRIRSKVATWIDQLSPRSGIEDVAPPEDLDRCVALLLARDLIRKGSQAASIEAHIESCKLRLKDGPFPGGGGGAHNGTLTLGRLCYLVCRYLSPAVVVETGVAYGVTSTYVLQALSENASGTLHSLDFPPLAPNAEAFVGNFVPTDLRDRWKLSIEHSSYGLQKLFNAVGPVDIFIHDSLHTYAHMKWEFEMALRHLRPGGVIISDDIEGNRAFDELTRHPSVASWCAVKQQGKDAVCGAVRTKA